ncbi:MAG: hypothetical protein FJZ47_12325 [Candidatus Tectomicrobia bacterium]|uniref:Aldehyde oxidase/xanthine dehydrogenase first molybdopterin binding domain-containing protein n=1 Tax=Tectimicrobiota bacterium TaxID=2528274 RepID=A0A937W1P6_UNCTE|nr:hypothetical protein [Candidatus Tectomicrobia bacterium]
METAVDKLGEKLGMDPLEFRLLNSAKEGTRRATGPVFQRVGFVETLQAAKDHPPMAWAGPFTKSISSMRTAIWSTPVSWITVCQRLWICR